ncbi:MAG: LysM peptidoglycan-binding domain-containing protein [Mariprofundaceae bacterium]|nr:LysM peptidoglycan-binding domain-containing protein [Mariprofundaceae bacterium]
MLHRFSIALVTSLLLFSASHLAQADNLNLPEGITTADVKANLPQPYVVKKGDTLWDIANYFFKSPHQWLKVWEKNLYITNPDLIYPGNEIWFNVQKQGGLSTIHPQPTIISKPVERLERKIDTSLLITALSRQGFVSPKAINGVGYLLDSADERINYGANDHVYIKMQQPASQGDLFDVFRSGDMLYDPDNGKPIGILVKHLGQIEITGESKGIYHGVILKNFEEISRGDRLKPAIHIDTQIHPSYPKNVLQGKVLYIRNDAAEAGQNQVIAINLGINTGFKAGTTLSIHRAGRVIKDRVTGKEVVLPEEKIGELLVLVAHQNASLAIVTRSSSSINVGDVIRNEANH